MYITAWIPLLGSLPPKIGPAGCENRHGASSRFPPPAERGDDGVTPLVAARS